jgi:hypothetical protein
VRQHSEVDAEQCFLPIFMLFGLGAGSGAAGGRYGYGRRPGIGYGAPGMGGVRPGFGAGARAGGVGFVSPYVVGPRSPYVGIRRGPRMY